MIEIRPIPAEQTYPLRNLVLRPGKPISACQWPGDDDPGSFHVGAFVDGNLFAIASVIQQAPPDSDQSPDAAARSYRLRGMATHPDHRAQGLGAALLNDCIARTRAAGGELLWCNARTGALAFYRRAGFKPVGEPFELPEIGPHVQMVLNLRRGTVAEANP